MRRVHVMTANVNKLNPHLPRKLTYLNRDSTKIALVEFPLVNPLSEGLQVSPSETNVNDATRLRGTSPVLFLKLAMAGVPILMCVDALTSLKPRAR